MSYEDQLPEYRVRRPQHLQFEIPYGGTMFEAFKAACIIGRGVWINRPEWHGRAYVVDVKVILGSEHIKATCMVTCRPTGAPVPGSKLVPDHLYSDKQSRGRIDRQESFDGWTPLDEAHRRYYAFQLEDSMKVYETIVVSVNEQGEPTGVLQDTTFVTAKTAQAAKDQVLVDYAKLTNISGKDLSGYQVRVREFQSA